MATRATYLISTSKDVVSDKKETFECFYIHWDGYPLGACRYFMNMLKSKKKKISFSNSFKRGNSPPARLIGNNHNECDDSEYRYTFYSSGALIAKKIGYSKGKYVFRTIFKGQLIDFLDIEYKKLLKETVRNCHLNFYGRYPQVTIGDL